MKNFPAAILLGVAIASSPAAIAQTQVSDYEKSRAARAELQQRRDEANARTAVTKVYPTDRFGIILYGKPGAAIKDGKIYEMDRFGIVRFDRQIGVVK